MTKEVIGLVDTLYENRLETLLSVQDLVEAVIEALEVRTPNKCYRKKNHISLSN